MARSNHRRPSLGRSAKVSLSWSLCFAGVGVLLLTAEDVAASQDILDIFGRIEGFFVRLKIYTGVPLTPATTEKMVQISIEILDILGTATKEMIQSQASSGADGSGGWAKEYRQTDKRRGRMASVQIVKVTHKIDIKVTRIDDGVRGVDETVVVNNNVKAVDE
ncbi:hypothetical protein EDB83DRAFT_2582400 [Lactarius deliciosus]|nr:hypothetical protein EDB83DRAFT_2582400 [Lactarius deliciosus]